jgi:restriction system protein
VKAGVLFRFANEIHLGDVVVYPSRQDRLVNIGLVSGDYSYLPTVDSEYPNRRHVEWKLHVPRAQFSQPALYEIGPAITLFQISNNADEFTAALEGNPITTLDVDAEAAAEIAVQAEESVEDFVIKRLKNELTPINSNTSSQSFYDAWGIIRGSLSTPGMAGLI